MKIKETKTLKPTHKLSTSLFFSALIGLSSHTPLAVGEETTEASSAPSSTSVTEDKKISPPAFSVPESLTFEADDISYAEEGTNVVAEGNVHISSESGSLWADKIIYNPETRQIIAEGNITFQETTGITLYLDRMELSDSMKVGVLEQLRLRIGGEGGPALAAEKAEQEKPGVISLVNSVYSPCRVCKGHEESALPWKIRASKITYNKEEGNLTYKNAVLDVKDVPLIYVPYFKHPIGETKAQSGLLPVRLGSSTNRGKEATFAYYHSVSPQEDYTFRARGMSERGVQFQAEHRQLGQHLASEVRGSIISDDLNGELRSNFEGKGQYTFKPGRRMGLDAAVVSDDTYLDDFFERRDSYLASTLYGEDASKDHYYNLRSTFYQDLRDGKAPAETAQVLPRLQLEKLFQLRSDNETLTLSSDMLSLKRSEGSQSRRLITEALYNLDHISDSGNQYALTASVRADTYHIEADQSGATPYGTEGWHARAVPQVSAKWERPFISPTGTHKITPKIMGVLSPRGGNPDDIPNEDSVAYELDTTNLFDTNRFSGYDRIETGPRLIYGLDNHWGTPDSIRWRFFIGQSYRFFDDETLPETGGTQTKFSDWVGRTTINPSEWLTFNSEFRFDNANFEAKRMDNELVLGDRQKSYLSMTHTFVEGGAEEVFTEGRYHLTEEFSVEGQMRRDLRDEGKMLLSEGALVYTAQCYRLSLSAQRRGFTNRNVPPSTSFLFNIELLTLGRDYD